MTQAGKIRLAIGGIIFGALAAASALLMNTSNEPHHVIVADLLRTPRTIERIQLYPADSGQRGVAPPPQDYGFEYYRAASFEKIKDSHYTNKDGTSEDWQYRLDGSRTRLFSQDYFALLEGESIPRLHGAALFEADGQTYKKHVVRRVNGTVERIGQRLRDGRYEERYMFDDGVTLSRLRYFDQGLNFSSDWVYSWNAAHTTTYISAKVIRGDLTGQFYISLYRENGSLASTIKHSTGREEGSLFSSDGNHLIAEWGHDMASVSYFNVYQPGSDLPVQVWETLMGRMKVTILDPVTHTLILQQVWQERPDSANPGGKIYLLMKAATDFQGSSPRLLVEMAGNGSHPAELIYSPDGKEQTVKKLDKTGKNVVAIEKQDRDGTKLSSMTPSSGLDQGGVRIDPKLLKLPPRPTEPSFNDFGPQRLYDYP